MGAADDISSGRGDEQSPSPPRTNGSRIRLLLADDSERVRRGLGKLFAAVDDIDVVASAADGLEAVALSAELAPDVVLMDLAMPVLGGIEATQRIKAAQPTVRVLTFTAVPGQEEAARRAGAAGLLLKEVAPEEIVQQVRLAAS